MTSSPSSPSPRDTTTLLATFDRNSVWNERYTVGVDLGQSHDPTAIAVIRRIDDDPARPVFQVGHLERLPLNTPYPGVVQHVMNNLSRPPLAGKSELVIDFTGVGRPVFDMFDGRGISPIGVTITNGDAVTRDGMTWRVPKLSLISRLQALLHDGRLKIHKALADAPALVAELQEFRAEVTNSGYWRFGARSGKHDDLVLAVAIALWRAHGDNQHTGILEYYRRLANGGGWPTSPKLTPEPVSVRMRAPSGINGYITNAGRSLVVDANGVVELTEAEAAPLKGVAGWLRLNDAGNEPAMAAH